jgi:CubicO group peptidase (beta-lactamase class C family)
MSLRYGGPRRLLLLAFCTLAACTRPPQPSTAPVPVPAPAAASVESAPTATVSAPFAQLDADLTAQATADRFSGVVLVARGEAVLMRKAYGLADRSWNVPLTPTAKVQIASVTKQFTAAAILKLQDEGKLTVSDSVCRWVEPCPPNWAPMTLHHLMTHTSGMPDLLNQADYKTVHRLPSTPAEQTAASVARNLSFTPGTRYRYSNSGYNLLGYVIEKASGRPYAEYLKTTFFEPLGMPNTGYFDPRIVMPEMARGYDWERGVVNPHWRDPTVIFSAGGLYSNADDLRTWTRALHAGRVISPASLAQMTGRAGPPESYGLRPRPTWNLLYAYGLMRAPAGRMVAPSFDDEQIFHTGSWNGFRNYLTYAPGADVTVVVLSNRIDQSTQVLLTAQKAMAAALGRPAPTGFPRD